MFDYASTEDIEKGLVSIIIPAYQAEKHIERSVKSALEQTYSFIEVIVVENGSTDRTLAVLNSIQDKRLVLLRSEKGVSNARNKGIANSKGEFLLFLDADDWLEKDAIKNMISIAVDADVVSGRYSGDTTLEKYNYCKYEAGSEEYLIKCLCMPTKRGNCTGNLYRTKFLKDHSCSFDSELSHAEDSVFFIGLLLKNPVIIDLEKPVYHVFSNPESATRGGKSDYTNDFCKAITEIYALISESNCRVKNAGYVFALNQLLVILVNNNKSMFELIPFIKTVTEKKVFSEAIDRVDISQITGLMKHVITIMKKKHFFALATVVKVRAFMNAHRMRKEAND